MKPIYFPTTYVSASAAASLRALFPSVVTCQPFAGRLPPDMRAAYAASLARLTSPGVRALLVAFEYPQEMRGGPPFSVEAGEISALFEPAFRLEEVERVDVIAANPRFSELGIPALFETAFLLTRA